MPGFKKHGEAQRGRMSLEYRVWAAAKTRCFNQKQKCWKNYGGRGITMCARWVNSFEAFLADMGRCPPGLTLDRKDNNGNYEPGNCRWATRVEQSANSRPKNVAKRSHCAAGHEYTEANTYVRNDDGSRQCRQCHLLRQRRRHQMRRRHR